MESSHEDINKANKIKQLKIDNIIYRHKFSSDHKLEMWGYGEWVEEADICEFLYKNFICYVERQPSLGHFCGCVCFFDDKYLECQSYIDVHGGITLVCKQKGINVVGFDCVHSTDIYPAEKICKKNVCLERNEKYTPYRTYKNMKFCIDQCRSMVDQIISFYETQYMKKTI